MLLYFVLLLKNVFHSQYIPYVSYFHIFVFLFCDDELYMLKSNKLLFCSVLFKTSRAHNTDRVHNCRVKAVFIENDVKYHQLCL